MEKTMATRQANGLAARTYACAGCSGVFRVQTPGQQSCRPCYLASVRKPRPPRQRAVNGQPVAHGDGRFVLTVNGRRRFRYQFVWDDAHPDDPIRPGEHVHHINGDASDDRPDNLVKLSPSAHAVLHNTSGRKRAAHQRAAVRRERGPDGRFLPR